MAAETGAAPAPASPAPTAPKLSRLAEAIILAAILLGAATLRLSGCGESPPGLNQDEAANGWNAWCLLKTGMDQAGVSWPVFYTRALGSNYTTLNIYLLMPIQAIGGLNVWTTRAPAALGGILTVFLIYFVGKKLLGKAGGLLAAGFLAVNPWHLLASRWGSEANICPLLAIAPLSLLLAARLPPGLTPDRAPNIALAALAGVLTAVCCYGYPATLIFVPLFLIALLAVSWPQWRPCLRRSTLPTVCSRRSQAAVLIFAMAAAAVFAPLAWQHVFKTQEIEKRAEGIWIWNATNHPGGEVSFAKKTGAVLSRYAEHFGADWLFLRGDRSSIQSPPGMGMFHWYMLPLMLLGLVWGVRSFRSSVAARVVLAWVVLYPAGDCLAWHRGDDGLLSLHSLRSSPGICGMVLLAAAGAVFGGSWLLRRSRPAFWAATFAVVLVAAGLNVRYLRTFFGEYNSRSLIYRKYHTDLVEACRWLKPNLDKYDAVFCTTILLNQPYIITLHELEHSPARWLADEKVRDTARAFDDVYRYGKMHFLHYQRGASGGMVLDPRVGLEGCFARGKAQTALFVLRRIPARDGMSDGTDWDEEPMLRRLTGLRSWSVVHEIRRPGDNEVVLKLVEATVAAER